MSLSQAKRNSMRLYLLQMIARKQPGFIAKAAKEFDVTPATIYKCLSNLIEENTIKKDGKGKYSLVSSVNGIVVKIDDNTSEERVYNQFFKEKLADLPANVRGIWEYILSEMLNNAIDHSGADKMQLILITDALTTTAIVADNGVGIFKKIMNGFNYDSIEEAAGELFKGKITTDKANHSGEGIFFSSRAADRFVILSSNRTVTYTNGIDGSGVDYKDLGGTLDGTVIFVALSNHSKKRLRDVFDEFSDVEEGFNKTGIPIAAFFDGAPVSRSQAKRLCNRLDEFSEVVLDFANVEWMGQGFAHQVFVVFQREHPGIKLTSVNMSGGVEDMYKHVINTR